MLIILYYLWYIRVCIDFFYRFIFTLPELTDEGYRVSICGLLDTDISKWSVIDFTVRSTMNFDVRLMEESCLGDVYIMDLSGFTFKHLSHYTIGFIKKCVLCQIVSKIVYCNLLWYLIHLTTCVKFIWYK